MKKTELKNYIATESELHPSYQESDSYITSYPFVDIDTKEVRFSVAQVLKLEHESDPTKNHTTILAFDGKEYFFWCGDNYIDNTSSVTPTKGKERVDDALKFVKNDISNAKDEMSALFHKEIKSSPCRFWAAWKSKGTICSHVKHLLHFVNDNNVIKELEEKYKNYTTVVKKVINETDDYKLMKKMAFKKHYLTTGPKGFGKTFEVYEYMDKENIPKSDFFEIGGFEGLESVDLLGQNIPYVKEVKKSNKKISLVGNNQFASSDNIEHIQDLVWLDGALSAAFRNAHAGNKTVLLIDELLRIPSRELSILIAALTPDNKGYFTLRTRRILELDDNGCGVEEVIKVKKENLWIVATTNIGAGYDIDEIDEALYDRFFIHHKTANRDKVKSIVEKAIKDRKFKAASTKKLMEFFDEITNYVKIKELSKIINTRHITEAIELAEDENDLPLTLKQFELKWIDRDIYGEPDVNHQKLIDKTINSIWK